MTFDTEEQINRRRIPSDAWLTNAWMLQLAGQDPKDSYMTLFVSTDLNKVQELYHKWPEMAGCRLRIINHNKRVYKNFMKWFKWDHCNSFVDSRTTYHFEQNYQNVYETVMNKKVNTIDASFVTISNEAKRTFFNKFIERMADAVKPKLKLIKGGL
jgi:hypothetical protein|tara:strand:- start:61 stop:528 length:468 start_codon:yes stop_codon:yes gene_type:complete